MVSYSQLKRMLVQISVWVGPAVLSCEFDWSSTAVPNEYKEVVLYSVIYIWNFISLEHFRSLIIYEEIRFLTNTGKGR